MKSALVIWKRRRSDGAILGFATGGGQYLLVREVRPTNAWRLEHRPAAGGVRSIGNFRTVLDAQNAAHEHALKSCA